MSIEHSFSSDEPRAVTLDDDAPEDAALTAIVVAVRAVHRGAVVDHEHVTLPPHVLVDDLRADHPIEQVLHVRPEIVYQHVWRKGDVLVIDDRATMHRAHGDYDRSQSRVLWRIIVEGDRPRLV